MLDVQAYPDHRGIDLKWVGVRGVRMPITLIERDGTTQVIQATMAMGVELPGSVKGVHMSRFMVQMAEWSRQPGFSLDFRAPLHETIRRSQSSTACIDFAFSYFVNKRAPITGLEAPMAIECRLQAKIDSEGVYHQTLALAVPMSTLCPCSKEISSYGAHNQRAELRVKLNLTRDCPWIGELVPKLEACGSCPVFPILRRPDERWVTERQYDNAKFVEDVAREATLVVRDMDGVAGFAVEVEAFESIHAHNAWTFHHENYTELLH